MRRTAAGCVIARLWTLPQAAACRLVFWACFPGGLGYTQEHLLCDAWPATGVHACRQRALQVEKELKMLPGPCYGFQNASLSMRCTAGTGDFALPQGICLCQGGMEANLHVWAQSILQHKASSRQAWNAVQHDQAASPALIWQHAAAAAGCLYTHGYKAYL